MTKNIINDDTCLGMVLDWDDTRLIYWKDIFKQDYLTSQYSIEQDLDIACETDLVRFDYDPFTGEKIDWGKLKEAYDNRRVV